jgi:hypothetical protein
VGERLVASVACGFVALVCAESPLLFFLFGGLAVAALFIDE